MARIPRNLLWCSHIHLCIFLWYKRHKVWKRSSLFKGDVATLSASHLASVVLFLLQPFCLSGIYNIFTYVFHVCTAIKIRGKVRRHKSNGPVTLVLCRDAFCLIWGWLVIWWMAILYSGEDNIRLTRSVNHFGDQSEAHRRRAMQEPSAAIDCNKIPPWNTCSAAFKLHARADQCTLSSMTHTQNMEK